MATKISPGLRRCLKCDKTFESKHKFNRICSGCWKTSTRSDEVYKVVNKR